MFRVLQMFVCYVLFSKYLIYSVDPNPELPVNANDGFLGLQSWLNWIISPLSTFGVPTDPVTAEHSSSDGSAVNNVPANHTSRLGDAAADGTPEDSTCDSIDSEENIENPINIDINDLIRLLPGLNQSIEICFEFKKFVSEFGKRYETPDEIMNRFQVFVNNVKIILGMNVNCEGTALFGITKFADLTTEEFKRRNRARHRPRTVEPRADDPQYTSSLTDIALYPSDIIKKWGDRGKKPAKIPMNFDWRDHNAVTPVVNQGKCGSCFAISAVSNIEGQYAIKHKKLLNFSVQEILDCDEEDAGCDGGGTKSALEWVKSAGGLQTREQYPTRKKSTGQCQHDKHKKKVKVTDVMDLPSDENYLVNWLYRNGPISVALNSERLQFYKGGVDKPKADECSPDGLDHAMLLVGYGVEKNRKGPDLRYWIIKNSWGPDWGENGYYRLVRGQGACGVHKDPSSARVE